MTEMSSPLAARMDDAQRSPREGSAASSAAPFAWTIDQIMQTVAGIVAQAARLVENQMLEVWNVLRKDCTLSTCSWSWTTARRTPELSRT